MNQLRDFLYLDGSRLDSFVSQIQGGLANQIEEIVRRQGGATLAIDVKLPLTISTKAEGGKHKESEHRQTIQITQQALFLVLEDYLRANSMVVDLESTGDDEFANANMSTGQFVVARGIAEPPAVEHWISQVRALVSFIDKHWKLVAPPQNRKSSKRQKPPSRQEIESIKDMVSFLEDMIHLGQADSRKQYVRIGTNLQKDMWCALIPEYLLVPLDATLPAQVTVLGRIDKVLSEGEVVKMVDFSGMSEAFDMDKLIGLLNTLAPFTGQRPLTEKDLQANYPGMFITPVAVYR